MLQNIRESMTGPIAWFIVGLIVLPFAFWGVDQFNTGGADPVLVEVGDQEITQSQYQRGYQQRYQQLASLMGENFRPDLIDQSRFQASVLEDLISESLLRQFTDNSGYRVPDAQLFEFIREVPAFQQDGAFSTEAYRRALANQGFSPAAWEQRLRASLEIDQMRRGVLESAFTAPAEAAIARSLENQQRFLSYVRFAATDFTDGVEVADEDLQRYFEDNQSRVVASERVKLAYVDLDADQLEPAEAPSEDVLRVIYEAEKGSRFTTAEERRASHVLIKFGADKDAARDRLESIREAILGGANFGEQAKAHSEDPGSKSDGGSLGWVRRGQMVDAFERALFDLAPGSISRIVETEFGWHVIRLDEVKPGTVQAFEDEAVQRQLVELYRAREGERRFQELADQLEQVAFESPDSLTAVSEATGLPVKTTGWFGRGGGAGLAADDGVREAAFSAEVMNGENSRPITLGPSRLVVVRQAEYEAARQRTLDEVRTEVHAQLLRERSAAMARERAQSVMAAVGPDTSLDEAAQAVGAEVQSHGLIQRDASDVDRAIVERLFKMPRPAEGQSSFASVTLPNGDTAVLALSAVQVAEDSEASGGATEQQLRDAQAGAEFAAYRAWIREQIDVEAVRSPVSEGEGG